MSTLSKLEVEQKEIQHLKALALNAFKSGSYQGMPESVIFNIMMSARDLGVSPYKALNGGFVIVNGKISMSTALMTDRIRSEGHSVKIIEWTSQKCVIIGQRKDNGDSVKFEYTMEDAQLAGLTGSMTWKKYPKNMLYNRAMSTIARVLFPDVVGNCYSEDEKEEISGKKKDYFASAPMLEDATVNMDTGEIKHEYLSEEQIENLLELMRKLDDSSVQAKILSHFKIEGISSLLAKDYEMAVKIYMSKIAEKTKKAQVEEVGQEDGE